MKKKYFFPALIITLLVFISCSKRQETILDRIVHVEDSVLLNVPKAAMLCEKLTGIKELINIGDCKLYCEIEGEGTPLVLIHGGPGGTHHFFHPWLSQLKNRFKLIYFDQRGCGQSDFTMGDGYSFEQSVEDLENLRKALNIDKWIVLGLSYGGGLAQYYTIKYPENVIGQVLVSTVPMVQQGMPQGSRDDEFLSDTESKKMSEVYQQFTNGKITYSQMLYNIELNGGWKRSNFYKPSLERIALGSYYDIISDKNYSSDFDAYNFEKAFDGCPIPTLLEDGKYDLAWKEEKSLVVRKNHTKAKFVLFENSGHLIYQDEPKKFMKVLREWADSIPQVDLAKIAEWKAYSQNLLNSQFTLIRSSKSFIKLIRDKGVKEATQYYQKTKRDNHEKEIFFEGAMNYLGYEYMNNNKIDEAIEIFQLNVSAFPKSWNAYDSLGEAYIKKGDKQKAKENYRKSLDLNPENTNAAQVLKSL